MPNKQRQGATAAARPARVLPHAPDELASGRLRRLGEGIGKVVYASEHWVVKRERTPLEIITLIVIWKMLRRLERLLPGSFAGRLLAHPSRQIRVLRALVYGVVLALPRSIWFTSHAGDVWRLYRRRDALGEGLARTHLEGTGLMPQRVTFPPMRVKIGGWPGWMAVSEATERVECTLYHRLNELSRAHRFDEVEIWLERFLEMRQAGWQRGVFSVDAHLKNFGVAGEHVVLLDPGGLTSDWGEIAVRLTAEAKESKPHVRLGLGTVLRQRSDLAERFNRRWRETVSTETVRRRWPAERLPQ
jgi:hypothetical protein